MDYDPNSKLLFVLHLTLHLVFYCSFWRVVKNEGAFVVLDESGFWSRRSEIRETQGLWPSSTLESKDPPTRTHLIVETYPRILLPKEDDVWGVMNPDPGR